MDFLISLGLTGIWLFFCSADSPLAVEAITHLFSWCTHEEVGPCTQGPGTWHPLVGWYQEPTKVSYIVSTKVAPSYYPQTALFHDCVSATCRNRKGR